MRILGLDLGSRTLGMAMSTSDEKMALSKETFRFNEDDYEAAILKVKEYIDKYKIETIVLGLPKHMNGDEGIRAQISHDFKDELEARYNVKVELMDERLTTVVSLNSLKMMNSGAKKRKEMVDQFAAQTILQDYLDRKNLNEEE